jgi:helicase-like protein
VRSDDLAATRELRAVARAQEDPKANALAALLAERGGKTIVFVEAAATIRHLLRRLRGRRVAGVVGETALFAGGPGGRAEALRAFAPLAQHAGPPPPALETDVLVATDLLSEGLNLQDATRVVHYDLPWSPARLAQRVGRIDRLGSPHGRIETITFLPHPTIERALAVERRLTAKLVAQRAAGAAQVESLSGHARPAAGLDWCDRLHGLVAGGRPAAATGACAAAQGSEPTVVLVVRIGALVEALVVADGVTTADPRRATRLLEAATAAQAAPVDRRAIDAAIRQAAPFVRVRLAAVAGARWRAGDRDRLARRLIPWVLTAARRAARRRDTRELERLDGLVSRLALGMTAGEELLLEELLRRRATLAIGHLLAWHERLPPISAPDEPPTAELVAALVVEPDRSVDGSASCPPG